MWLTLHPTVKFKSQTSCNYGDVDGSGQSDPTTGLHTEGAKEWLGHGSVAIHSLQMVSPNRRKRWMARGVQFTEIYSSTECCVMNTDLNAKKVIENTIGDMCLVDIMLNGKSRFVLGMSTSIWMSPYPISSCFSSRQLLGTLRIQKNIWWCDRGHWSANGDQGIYQCQYTDQLTCSGLYEGTLLTSTMCWHNHRQCWITPPLIWLLPKISVLISCLISATSHIVGPC